MSATVLLVDDEPRITTAIQRTLRREAFEICTAASAREALEVLANRAIDVVVSDEKMPGMSGTEFLAVVQKEYPATIRIVLTGHASLDTAIKAINEGSIFRFMTKPCNPSELAVTIRQALQQKQLIDGSRRMLGMLKKQSSMLDRLEEEHPGITSIERDESGAIVIDGEAADVDALLRHIDEETSRTTRRKGDIQDEDPEPGRAA